jgi:SAM-dependent methyltransferase
MTPPSNFDAYAGDYDTALQRGLALAGESKDYFAHGRVAWTARQLRARGVEVGAVLDFGCGTGSATPFLLEILRPRSVLGVDPSVKSIEEANSLHAGENVRFQTVAGFRPNQQADLAFCNGVFHHIPVAERLAAARWVYDCLRPGGGFAFWENNPWNPGTRLIMSRIPFDRDAVTLSILEARRLLTRAGFQLVRGDFLFVFPNRLRWLRPVEPWICRLPLGGQYLVLCRKDGG